MRKAQSVQVVLEFLLKENLLSFTHLHRNWIVRKWVDMLKCSPRNLQRLCSYSVESLQRIPQNLPHTYFRRRSTEKPWADKGLGELTSCNRKSLQSAPGEARVGWGAHRRGPTTLMTHLPEWCRQLGSPAGKLAAAGLGHSTSLTATFPPSEDCFLPFFLRT